MMAKRTVAPEVQLDFMDNILSLLGSDDGGFLFPHLFLRLLPTTVRAALANSPCLFAGDHRGLAEEVDRVLLATRRFSVQFPPEDSAAVCYVSSTGVSATRLGAALLRAHSQCRETPTPARSSSGGSR